ncbi:hypothetical protein CLOP_g22014 [Closterium sp. NIES-67]|nr:hypothetical protein CLOP_g22014 [Closterium sp. NIES-67]
MCKLMVVEMPHPQHSLQGTPTRTFHGHRNAPAHDAATLLRWQLEGGDEENDDDDGFISSRLRGGAPVGARTAGGGVAAGATPGRSAAGAGGGLGGVLGSMMGGGTAVAHGGYGDVEDSEMTMPRGSELAAMLADRVAVDRQLMERAMQLSVFGNKMQKRPRRPSEAASAGHPTAHASAAGHLFSHTPAAASGHAPVRSCSTEAAAASANPPTSSSQPPEESSLAALVASLSAAAAAAPLLLRPSVQTSTTGVRPHLLLRHPPGRLPAHTCAAQCLRHRPPRGRGEGFKQRRSTHWWWGMELTERCGSEGGSGRGGGGRERAGEEG